MQQAAARLRAAGDDSPHVCARALAQAVTGLDRTGLILARERPLAAELAALTETLYLLPLTPPDPQEEPSPLPEQFRRQIAEIRAGLERRKKIERELAETEIRLAPPEKFYGEAITEAQRPSPALPPEAQRFLEQVESRWIGD